MANLSFPEKLKILNGYIDNVIRHHDGGHIKEDEFKIAKTYWLLYYLMTGSIEPTLAMNIVMPYTNKPFNKFTGKENSFHFDLPSHLFKKHKPQE